MRKVLLSNRYPLVTAVLALGLSLGVAGCMKQPASPGKTAGSPGSVGQQAGSKGEEQAMQDQGSARSNGAMLEDSEPAAGVTEIALDIDNGAIECTTADVKPGAVVVDWRITLPDGPGPRPRLEDLTIELSRQGGKLTVSDTYSGPKLGRRPELKLWVKLHKDIPLTAVLGNGSLDLTLPRLGALDLGNGSIKAEGELQGGASINIGNGSLSGRLLVAGGAHSISLGNGRIALELAPGSNCAITATTGVGQITANGFSTKRDWGLTGGTVTGVVGTGTGRLELSTGNGQIEITAAPEGLK